jgi:amino acid adenylation domain-containing protein
MSRGALFDVMVVEQAVDGLEFALPGVDSRVFGNEEDAWAFSRFDLVFHFQATEDGLALDINFNTDLFDAERIDRYGAQLVTLATAATALPTTAVGQLALLPAAELALIHRFATGASAERPPAATIFSVVAAIAERTPEQLALLDAHRSVTYAELIAAAERLAAHLNAAGIHTGDRVAVIATRSLESVIALLGITKIGAVYVPIDADYPAARSAALIAQVDCRLVLVESATQLAALPGEHPPMTVLEPFLNPRNSLFSTGGFSSSSLEKEGFSRSPPFSKGGAGGICAPNDVAYIIFTSGSTGQPKAVEVEHQGFINTTLGMIEKLELGAADRTLQFASPSFDAALINVSLALCAGGTLVLPPRAVIESIPHFLAFMQQTSTTCVTLPPTYLRLLEQAPLPTLRILITAGEAAPVADLSHYAHSLRTFNAYGPTEAAVSASIYQVRPTDAPQMRLPIGGPLPNTTLHILDAALTPLPLGVPGEICIGGVGVARGYVGQPELTAERFIQHPTSGARLYRTGDIGCWLTDGSIDFLGRTDHQVKISGHRIELAEVEQALRGIADISDAHVTTLARPNGALALVGYYVAATRLQLWPSVAEFFVYDHVAYSSMANDEARNQQYRAAFARHLPGKTVVDIGTGPFAILAQLAIAAGARKVYAIDLLAETAQKARETVAQLGLAERIEVIHGNALELVLPEPIDVCIAEIVGAIGGSEGAAKIINGVRHLLKDPTHMLPQRSLTRIAAVSVPEGCFEYAFPEIAAHYVEKIFAEVGRPFDLRLCVKNLSRDHLISTDGTFEDLDYTRDIPLETEHSVTLTVTKDSVLTGLVVWLDLFIDAEHHVDILDHPGSWLPVLLPVFPDGVTVTAGARLEFTVERRLHRNGLNPDFVVRGALVQRDGSTQAFTYRSDHISAGFRASPFYARLFPAHGVRRSDTVTPLTIRRHLSHTLPSYALPAYLVAVEALPLTSSGKVDRAALPAPELTPVVAAAAPETELEQQILRIWQSALERTDIGIDDDFFALGGDSIRAIQIASALRSQGLILEVKDIFTTPRVRDLAALLAGATPAQLTTVPAVPTVAVPLLPIQRWFFAAVTVERHHFNQAVELGWAGAFDAAAAAAAVTALWQHHEQLRVIFPEPGADGQQLQQLTAAATAPAVLRLPAAAPLDAYLAAAAQLHRSFNLATGPLFGAVIWDNGLAQSPPTALFPKGASAGGRVLLVAHHLVVDAVSWLILIEDFARAYAAAVTGAPVQLPAQTAAYLALAQIQIPPDQPVLKEGENEQLPLEKGELEGFPPPVTRDAHLGADALTVLLETVAPERGISLEALLLGALAQVWAELTGRPLVVMVERHGRDQVPAGLDVSRTVGWFTVVMTLTLDGHAGAYAAAAIAAQRLRDTAPTVPSATADLVFNHLGTLTAAAGGAFTVNWDAPGPAVSPALALAPGLELLTALEGGTLTLSVTARDHERGAQLLTAVQTTLAQIAAEGGVPASWSDHLGVDLEHLLAAD